MKFMPVMDGLLFTKTFNVIFKNLAGTRLTPVLKIPILTRLKSEMYKRSKIMSKRLKVLLLTMTAVVNNGGVGEKEYG